MQKLFCDICKQEIKEEISGCAKLEASWGYGSDYDGQVHELTVCPDCYDKLIGNVKDYVIVLRDSLSYISEKQVPRKGI